MSNEQKVHYVKKARRQDDVDLERALNAFELARSTWYYHINEKVSYEDKYEWLRPLLDEILRYHPDYGVRRIQTELRESFGHRINHKVLRRLLELWEYSLPRNVRRPSRGGVRSTLRGAGSDADLVTDREDIKPFEVSVTDFTDLSYANARRTAKLMPIIGHETKFAYGWAVGPKANRGLALKAWERATSTFAELGISTGGMIIHHDRDSVYTSSAWLWRLLIEDGATVSFAMRGAKDNTVIEAFHSTFKRENDSLFAEASDLAELRRTVSHQMNYYNHNRRHSSIGTIAPMAYIRRLRQTTS